LVNFGRRAVTSILFGLMLPQASLQEKCLVNYLVEHGWKWFTQAPGYGIFMHPETPVHG